MRRNASTYRSQAWMRVEVRERRHDKSQARASTTLAPIAKRSHEARRDAQRALARALLRRCIGNPVTHGVSSLSRKRTSAATSSTLPPDPGMRALRALEESG